MNYMTKFANMPMGANLCSTFGDEQMICVLVSGCFPPCAGVGAGRGLSSNHRGPGVLPPGKCGYFT